uniref:Predicted nucleic acid-binding protein, contains PIN domain n=1 Tax=Candidatus Kentrum sp. UNK TaxID=2126344 RepID=A0A451ADS3_9GAMM|nr:MAG: Predicted nucleic acid-binding protein, contains PIN domain [Candidatus Kentron sp. UNK]VFK71019.1 MAG: Predicted nucleic acid-binding protein, contains PIN domain [Candidatus Kentron sp. UNK]
MRGAKFIDTNIWVYAHLRSPNEPRHPIALDFVSTLDNGVISPQVMIEYYNVMLRSGQNDAWIQENLHKILSYVRLQPLNDAVVHRTWAIRNRYHFSIWDSRIIATALEAGCDHLCTEDLQHGQIIEKLKVIDPLQR